MSKFFPFVTGAVVMLFYYLGLDVATFYYMCIFGLLIMLLLDDVTPMVTLFVFMTVMISKQNSPLTLLGTNSDYYFRTDVLVQIAVLITLLVAAMVARVVLSIKKGNFKLSPTFFGLCAFCLALLLNGLLSDNVKSMNLVFGLILSFFFLGIFVFFSCNIKVTKSTFEYIAWVFIAHGLLLIIELIVVYATTEGIIVDGKVVRAKILLGWGMYNNMGVLIVMCIPAAYYLAGKYKYGWLFTIFGVILFYAAWFTMSRQSMLGSTLITICCVIMLLLRGKNKIINSGILIASLIALALTLYLDWDNLTKFFGVFFNGFGDGSGRLALYKEALAVFKEFPVFGRGFYNDLSGDPGFAGIGLVPDMYHNTYMQLLGSCGAVGLFAYAAHRATTVISFVKNITVERIYIAFTIIALLFINLFDNHLFYLFPTIIYSILLAVLIKSEDKNCAEKDGKVVANKCLIKSDECVSK
jgi:O-antigen ligase